MIMNISWGLGQYDSQNHRLQNVDVARLLVWFPSVPHSGTGQRHSNLAPRSRTNGNQAGLVFIIWRHTMDGHVTGIVLPWQRRDVTTDQLIDGSECGRVFLSLRYLQPNITCRFHSDSSAVLCWILAARHLSAGESFQLEWTTMKYLFDVCPWSLWLACFVPPISPNVVIAVVQWKYPFIHSILLPSSP